VTEERVNFARWRHVDEWMDGSGEIRWMDDSKLPSQILSTPIVSTPATDYIQTEAERLARFIEALDAMDGATEPMESDSVTSNCANCGHDRADHIYEEGACRPGFICQRECDKFVSAIQKPDTVTITISREAARALCVLDPYTPLEVSAACLAALEEER